MALDQPVRRLLAGCVLALAGVVPGGPAHAGPIPTTSGSVTLVVLNESFQFILQLAEVVVYSESGVAHYDDLGLLTGSLVVSFDPDPLVSYELSLTNTSGTAIQGALVLEFPVDPAATSGSPPAFARMDAQYLDSGGGIDVTAQHLPFLVEDIGQGKDTFLFPLQLDLAASSEAPVTLSAGPSPLPSGSYDRLAVQLTFALDTGDTGFFGGAISFPDERTHCNDGLDNDGDGFADFAGGDPGCSNPFDGSERSLGAPCDDGFDNDGDGASDATDDVGCAGPGAASESPQCQDGLDNDADGRIDFDGGASAGVPPGSRTDPDADCEDGGLLVGWLDQEQAAPTVPALPYAAFGALLLALLAAVRTELR